MSILTPARFLKTMRKNADMFKTILADIPQEQAANTWDGDWNVVAVMCHLRDFDRIFHERAQRMHTEENPELIPVDHEQLAEANSYNTQTLNVVLDDLLAHRAAFIAWFAGLAEADWQRAGLHPEHGAYTIFEQAVQVATHDIDHLEQLTRMLRQSTSPC